MAASSAVQEITSLEDFQEFLKSAGSSRVAAINFWAPWAAPCQQMNEVFAELSLKFPSIEAEQLADVAETFEVSAVPFFVLVKDSKVLARISGANPPSLTSALQLHASAAVLPPAQEASPPLPTNASPTAASEPTAKTPAEDLNERLAKLVKAASVMLFMKGTPSKPECGFSRTIVGILREKNVRYGFFNILADEDVRQGLKKFSDWPTYPQLYIDGEFVGGLDIVKEMLENGDFDELIKSSGKVAQSA